MTLLVGFNPDRDDQTAIELGATLARSANQDLLVVSVVPATWPTPVAGHTDREFERWAAERGAQAVAAAEGLLADHCGDVPSRAVWVPGRSVPAGLVGAAEEFGAAMIVIGSGHDGGYGHVHISSTADRLLHSSPVPVALATRGYLASDHGKVRRATCAFRGDDVSGSTLARTAEICQEAGASLRIATFAVRGRTMYPPEVSVRTEDSLLERWTEQAAASQQQALVELGAAGVLPDNVETVIASGRSWGAAIDRLTWDRDDVLVVGSSSAASILSRLFLGSSASKIVRNSPVPVIVVP